MIYRMIVACLLAGLSVGSVWGAADAPLRLGAPFGDGAVLQRDRKVPVWGDAAPGAAVTVSFAGQTKTATADQKGAWRVDLDPLAACAEGRPLTVTASDSRSSNQPISNQTILRDVLVGEVWFCSGQSNMQQPLGIGGLAWSEENGQIEAKLTDEPTIRFATCGAPLSATVKRTVPATNLVWKAFRPDTLGGFGNVPYHFAMNVRRSLKGVPIGLVWSAVGGSNIRPWISAEGYADVPELDDLRKAGTLLDESTPEGKKKGFWSLAHQPTVFYNSKVAPVAPYALRGTIWYQGESNIADGDRYRLYLHALAKGWRRAFENDAMEFYTVQLMPYLYKNRADTVLGEFWTAQQKFAAEDPHAAYVVTDDCGLLDEIHSPHKRNVGLRLALCALNRCYGRKDLEYRSPVFKSATIVSNGIVAVGFDHAPQGLYVPAYHSNVRNFELCGADGVWHEAKGTIDRNRGSRLEVVSDRVPYPQQIRYMYRQGMQGHLFSRSSCLMPGAFVGSVGHAAQECRVRDGIGRTVGKLERGEDVTVAYLGGSITQGAWREQTTAWLRTRYPKARITEVNAALGGTGSAIGVFRLRDDVLSKKPDLVFVEFACNDSVDQNPTVLKSMEGIVRQTWKALPETDLCFTYVITGYMTNDYCRGVYHRVAAVHEEVAERYGIPSLCFGLRVASLVKKNAIVMCASRELSEDDRKKNVKIAFPVSGECPEPPKGAPKPIFSMDGVHPTVGGHGLYTDCIRQAFDKLGAGGPCDHAKRLAGAPLVADNLENASWVRPSGKMFVGGSWKPYARTDDWRSKTLFFEDMMSAANGLFWTETPGATLNFRFKGRKCSLYALYGPDCGQVKIRHNGVLATKEPVPLFDRYCRWYRLQEVPLYEGPEKEMDISVTLDDREPDRKTLGCGRFTDEELAKEKYRKLTFFVSKIMFDGEVKEAVGR